MQILKTVDELKQFFKKVDRYDCLADTSFLYALSYDDDQYYKRANEILDLFAENEISIYANVISRMEFVDLIFRKQVTRGCIQLFNSVQSANPGTAIFKLLKNIRDKDTEEKRKNKSYKVTERRLKDLREVIGGSYGISNWKDFCKKFVGSMLASEWSLLEDDLGLNYIGTLEGQSSDLLNAPLKWPDMVQIMGENGVRGPDAMIVNVFMKSKLPLLVTSDRDFEDCFSDPMDQRLDKAIYLL